MGDYLKRLHAAGVERQGLVEQHTACLVCILDIAIARKDVRHVNRAIMCSEAGESDETASYDEVNIQSMRGNLNSARTTSQ